MSSALSEKNGVKSRKKKDCCLCGEAIQIGEIKDVRSGVDSEGFSTMHMHPECHAYERVPSTVDHEWYLDISGAAFDRSKATENVAKEAGEVKP